MSKFNDYFELAAKCVGIAAETDVPWQKALLVDMANAWLKLADQKNRRHTDLVYETPQRSSAPNEQTFSDHNEVGPVR
jgi:hypothetical protein